ncbi:hypothetical protein PV797_19855 [Clostridiaceae bacterium M8S5]|nr:hypothetical protein PV797_19855 [Clostridiaceae bacterium M8S5]
MDYINELLACNLTDISKKIIKKDVIFYDACLIVSHARKNQVSNKYDMIDYFNEDDLIILTDKVLEEALNINFRDKREQNVQYIKQLKQKVSDIILLKESDLENLLILKHSNKAYVRSIIQHSIKGALVDLPMNYKKPIYDNKILGKQDFIKKALSILDIVKRDRGKVSILICLLVMKNIKNKNFRVISDDYQCFNYINRIFNKGENLSRAYIESTAKIVQQLYDSRIWNDKCTIDIKQTLDLMSNKEHYKTKYYKIIDGIKCDNLITKKITNEQLAFYICNRMVKIKY